MARGNGESDNICPLTPCRKRHMVTLVIISITYKDEELGGYRLGSSYETPPLSLSMGQKGVMSVKRQLKKGDSGIKDFILRHKPCNMYANAVIAGGSQ